MKIVRSGMSSVQIYQPLLIQLQTLNMLPNILLNHAEYLLQ